MFDPYAALGLTRGASTAEVKRAYRNLAKRYHPDAAGQAAMPRFLEIQAAYEMLVERPGGAGGASAGRSGAGPARPPSPRPGPAPADASARARSARDAYRDRARRTGPAPRSPGSGSPGSGSPRSEAPRSEAPRSEAAGEPGRDGARGPEDDRARRARRKATLGSTSYDDAAGVPFEPDWSGSAWYGASSGTYWTVNPKEYADPRKHGPEYQERARRAAAAAAAAADSGPGGSAAPDDPDVADLGSSAEPPGPAGSAFREAPATGTGGADWSAAWAAREAGRSTEAADVDAERHGWRRPEQELRWPRAPARSAPPPLDLDPERALRRLDPFRFGTGARGRLVLAALGGPPIAVVMLALAGELTGCGRFVATCGPEQVAGSWLAAVAAVVAVAAIVSLGRVLAHGGLAVMLSAVPAAVVLSVTGGTVDRAGSAAALVVLLAASWLVGIGIGLRRSIQLGRRRPPPPASEPAA